jgi:hypothetical protein
MNSATSAEKRGVALTRDGSTADAGFKPWHFFVLASLIAATAAVIMSRQSSPEHLILISLTIAAAGFAAAGFYRMLAPLTSQDVQSFAEPLSDRLRSALEREKALALRSIKELEFDRAMGKLSSKDFEEMTSRLRSRAMNLMKQLDQDDVGYAPAIERELGARLANRDQRRNTVAAAAPECPGCGTVNDSDAAFCKRCGRKLGDG